MLSLLREQGFVGGSDKGFTWIKEIDGTFKVNMPDGPRFTLFGQRERRMVRDRSFVGERDEKDGSRIGPPSVFESGRGHPLTLLVESVRGKITEEKFELHPLALLIPPMTEAERESLRTSIEQEGVRVPLEIYEKKILDGRNRAYFAAVFKKPVRMRIFEGTEAQARQHVMRLNLHRRHLPPDSPSSSDKKNADEGKWQYRAANLAKQELGLVVAPAAVLKAYQPEAKPEKTQEPSNGNGSRKTRTTPLSVNKALGQCETNLKRIRDDQSMDYGNAHWDKLIARAMNVVMLGNEVVQGLRKRSGK
jgi:hypothetical protein